MANKRYDAVFIGNNLIAFSAAALLAKQGRSVLLLAPDPSAPSGHAFQFSEGPLLYFGYEHGGAVDGFFSRLAYPIPSLKQKGLLYRKVAPLLQIIQSTHRTNLYAEQEPYFDELKREFGPQTEKLKNLFDQIERDAALYYPFLGQFQQLEIAGMGERLSEWRKQLDFSQAVRAQQKNSAYDYLSPYAFSAALREYFNLLALFSARKPLSQLSAFDLILLLSSLKKGGVRMIGGYQTIVTFFHNLIKGFGGSIQYEKIIKHEKEGKIISSVSLSGGETIESPQFILSRMTGKSPLAFYFTIRKNLLPRPMKTSLLLTWSGKCPTYLENIIVLCLDLREKNEAGHTEILKMTASVFPKKQMTLSEADRKILEKYILERLYALIPFSESGIHPQKSVSPEQNQMTGQASEGDPVFCTSNQAEEIKGKRRELLKGAAAYYQNKEHKNLILLPSDRGNMLGWSSDFIVGAGLADVIEQG